MDEENKMNNKGNDEESSAGIPSIQEKSNAVRASSGQV